MKHTCVHIGILSVIIVSYVFLKCFIVIRNVFGFSCLFVVFLGFHFLLFCRCLCPGPLLEPFSGLLGSMVMQRQAAHGQAPGRLQAGPSRQHPVDFKRVDTLLSQLQQSPTAQAA